MNIERQKRELRLHLRDRLMASAPAARRSSGALLVAQLSAMPAWQQSRRVLLFAPMPSEPDVDALWQDGHLAGRECVYPAVSGKELALYRVLSPDALRAVPPWNLREPVCNPASRVALAEIDLMLVPGLAFDGRGGRLGRGGGFYDRLLATRPCGNRPIAVGVGFGFQRLDSLPLAPHDALLDAVVFC